MRELTLKNVCQRCTVSSLLCLYYCVYCVFTTVSDIEECLSAVFGMLRSRSVVGTATPGCGGTGEEGGRGVGEGAVTDLRPTGAEEEEGFGVAGRGGSVGQETCLMRMTQVTD